MKKLFILLICSFMVVVVLPSAVSGLYTIGLKEEPEDNEHEAVYKPHVTKEEEIKDQGKMIQVVNPETKELSYLEFEDYIKGVVAAEMPALFHIEALKAQAVASRTYAARKIEMEYSKEEIETGQAYIDFDEMRAKWGEDFDTYLKKISEAVDSTQGEVLTYSEELIEAVFHSTSAGLTENAQNIWQEERPYLVSVDSAYDENAPGFITESKMTEKEVLEKLLLSFSELSIAPKGVASQIQILSRTPAGYVERIQIGNIKTTGIAVREALSLRSANFTIHQQKDEIIFTTKGYGHGAGMSQYGANFMAGEGSTYKEILAHYYKDSVIAREYSGINISSINE